MAMPIFGNFLKACYSNPKTEIKEEPFTVPKNLSDEEIYQNILCEEIPLFEDEEYSLKKKYNDLQEFIVNLEKKEVP